MKDMERRGSNIPSILYKKIYISGKFSVSWRIKSSTYSNDHIIILKRFFLLVKV